MDIRNNKEDFAQALQRAHKEYPLIPGNYHVPQSECMHNFSFCIFCDGGAWDIMRCRRCGAERVKPCTFDDDFD